MAEKNRLFEAINVMIERINEASSKIRALEDDCKKFSVAPDQNRVYTAWVGYREALRDSLEELRRINDKRSAD